MTAQLPEVRFFNPDEFSPLPREQLLAKISDYDEEGSVWAPVQVYGDQAIGLGLGRSADPQAWPAEIRPGSPVEMQPASISERAVLVLGHHPNVVFTVKSLTEMVYGLSYPSQVDSLGHLLNPNSVSGRATHAIVALAVGPVALTVQCGGILNRPGTHSLQRVYRALPREIAPQEGVIQSCLGAEAFGIRRATQSSATTDATRRIRWDFHPQVQLGPTDEARRRLFIPAPLAR